jgi:ankyrin repeat protein
MSSQVDGDGNSPLHWASVKGHANIIDLLLLAQADPNLPNKDRFDLLTIFFGIDAGSSSSPYAVGRDTPLHWAASGGSAECVQKLLARNANPTAKNSENTTPLHFAAADGKAAVAVRISRSTVITAFL